MLNGIMLNGIMLNGIMLNGIMLNVMLNVSMLNVIVLSVIMLNVVAPQKLMGDNLQVVWAKFFNFKLGYFVIMPEKQYAYTWDHV